ncbi:MAG: HD family hydrolase, partial [Syntrophobacteraceae bacterium]
MKTDKRGLEREDAHSPLKGVANFLFEVGMLKNTPRSGFQFLGSGEESVAEHSFRATVIGYTLARLSGDADPFKVVSLCLFHDLPEARTGDMNYVNKRYVQVDENAAIDDL